MTDLSIPNVAKLRGITRMAVHKQVIAGRLPARRIVNARGGAAGEQYLIPLSALAPDEQARYWAQRGGPSPAAAEPPPAMTLPLSKPERAALVRRFLAAGRSATSAKALAAEAGIHTATLYRWIAEARKNHQDAVPVDLLGQGSTPVRFPASAVPADLLAAVVGWLLADPRRTVRDGHRHLCELLVSQTTVAKLSLSYVQFTRIVNGMAPPFVDLKRLRDSGAVPVRLTKTPKILRRWSDVPAGHLYVGDQHLLDYQCVLPETGEVVNLQLYLWMDAATTYWTGLAASFGPYTQYTVGLSLLDACRLHVPTQLLNDNGRQEKSAYVNDLWARLTGVIDWRNGLAPHPQPLSQGARGEDGRHFTTPHLPPVKPIEAQMAVFTRYLNQEELPGYRKRDPDAFRNQQRQGKLADTKKAGDLPTVEALLAAIARVVERHNTQLCRSEVDGDEYIPAERFWQGLEGRRIVLPDADLKALFYPRFERKVHNGCVRVKIGGRVVEFTHPALMQIRPDESVQVLINPLPPHDGGLALRHRPGTYPLAQTGDYGGWEPFCPLSPWLGRGLDPLNDREALEAAMKQKNSYLATFREALNHLHAKARALGAGPEPAPDKPAAQVVRLTDAARLRGALPESEAFPPSPTLPREGGGSTGEKAKVLDHQEALRRLVESRRARGL